MLDAPAASLREHLIAALVIYVMTTDAGSDIAGGRKVVANICAAAVFTWLLDTDCMCHQFQLIVKGIASYQQPVGTNVCHIVVNKVCLCAIPFLCLAIFVFSHFCV